MKKIYDAAERFCARHPRFGIPNLMRYIVIGNVVVYFLSMLSSKADATALDFLVFNLNGLLHGEVWRLVTFVFVPEYFSPFALIISLYFYYWIGSILEREWGTAKFTLYYAGGALLTLLGVVITSLITGNHFLTLAGTGYVNLSMFLAFAVLFPNMTVLLFFIIPIKIKWLAIVDGVFFAVEIARSILAGNVVGIITPVLALLNFAIFITPHVRYLRQKTQYPAFQRGGELPPHGASGAAATAKGALSPQVRRLRPHGHGLSRPAVPLLQQVRRLPLLLSGSYLLPCPLHGGVSLTDRPFFGKIE